MATQNTQHSHPHHDRAHPPSQSNHNATQRKTIATNVCVWKESRTQGHGGKGKGAVDRGLAIKHAAIECDSGAAQLGGI